MASTAAVAPWDAPYPAFSYSESQLRRRERCARAHYHAIYTAHRGWSAAAYSDSWRAYRLKAATAVAAAVGTAVHQAATACVEALRARAPMPTFESLRATAGESLNAIWRNSRARREEFLRSPKRVPLFLDALYGEGPTPSQLHRAAQTLDRALLALVACDEVWDLVRAAHPEDVLLMEPFAAMRVATSDGPVTCYGAADLIVRPSKDEPWRIIDFKSGSADGVIDQILTYALVAQELLKLYMVPRSVGIIVALAEAPGERVAMFDITPDDLRDAEERLHREIGKSRALLANPATNEPRAMDAFPMTSDARVCGSCAFRVLCHPEQVQPGAAIARRAA
jgi:hypothetical protein